MQKTCLGESVATHYIFNFSSYIPISFCQPWLCLSCLLPTPKQCFRARARARSFFITPKILGVTAGAWCESSLPRSLLSEEIKGERRFASGLPHGNRTDSFDFSCCFGFRHRVLKIIFPMFEIQIGNTENIGNTEFKNPRKCRRQGNSEKSRTRKPLNKRGMPGRHREEKLYLTSLKESSQYRFATRVNSI